jgi:hypothetical protein
VRTLSSAGGLGILSFSQNAKQGMTHQKLPERKKEKGAIRSHVSSNLTLVDHTKTAVHFLYREIPND